MEPGKSWKLIAQMFFLQIMVTKLIRKHNIHPVQGGRKCAAYPAVEDTFRAKSGDHHLCAAGGIDLADPTDRRNDLFAILFGDVKGQQPHFFGLPVAECIADQRKFFVHCTDNADCLVHKAVLLNSDTSILPDFSTRFNCFGASFQYSSRIGQQTA